MTASCVLAKRDEVLGPLVLPVLVSEVSGGCSILLYTSPSIDQSVEPCKLASNCQLMILAINQRLGSSLVRSIKYAIGPFKNGEKFGWILMVDVEKSQAETIGRLILRLLPEMLDFVGVNWSND